MKHPKHTKQYTNIIIMVVVVAVIALNFVTIYKRNREGVGLESLQKDRELEWDDLDPDRRRAWNFLGWTKTAWNSKIDSAGGIPNNPEQDKKDSIRKYTTYMKSVLKRIRPTSTHNKTSELTTPGDPGSTDGVKELRLVNIIIFFGPLLF